MQIEQLKLRLIQLVLEIENQEVLLKVLETIETLRAENTPLSNADRIYLEKRLKELEENPEKTISLEEMETHFMQKNELPEEVQNEIEEALQEVENGEVIPHNEALKLIRQKHNLV